MRDGANPVCAQPAGERTRMRLMKRALAPLGIGGRAWGSPYRRSDGFRMGGTRQDGASVTAPRAPDYSARYQ